MHLKNPFRRMACGLRRIRLADRFLLLYLLLLLGQTFLCIFVQIPDTQGSEMIDIVMRTTLAGIFGYFISGNFIVSENNPPQKPSTDNSPPPANLTGISATPSARIGFSSTTNDKHTESVGHCAPLPTAEKPPPDRYRQQIVIVSLIGLVSLALLIYIRTFAGLPMRLIPVVSQLRDFVSGSIGVLIGRARGSTPPR